jgi:3-deoxy-D-manno-octulosonic-acid transferase
MKFIFLIIYRILIAPLALAILLIASLFHDKIRDGLNLRLKRFEFLRSSRRTHVIWFHCSSGEFEYVKPLIRIVKQKWPEMAVLVTYFSPSYRKAIESFPEVDIALPLPLDLPGPITAFIRRYEPQILILARTDLWPEMLHQVRRHGIPSYLVSATLSHGRAKTRFPLSLVTHWLYSLVDEIDCVSTADSEEFQRLNLRQEIFVSGDTRFDQVFERLENPKPLMLKFDHERVFISGSTWPEDEAVLLDSVPILLKSNHWQWILVPHEPTLTHLEDLEEKLKKKNLSFIRLSQIVSFDPPEAEVILVDKIGVLAELYKLARIAFVGGSFRKSVHSVMEPLAAGCLTFVGPYHHNNREALTFQKTLVTEGQHLVEVVNSAPEFSEKLSKLMNLDLSKWTIHRDGIIHPLLSHRGASLRVFDHWLKKNLTKI